MDSPGSSSSADGAQVQAELELFRVNLGQPVEVLIGLCRAACWVRCFQDLKVQAGRSGFCFRLFFVLSVS